MAQSLGLTIFYSILVVTRFGMGLQAKEVRSDLFSDFEPGWKELWRERPLASRVNHFEVEENEGERQLRVRSSDSASALWRPLDCDAATRPVLSWRWKVRGSLAHIEDQRERAGDDYAARVAVMFDGSPFRRNTRTLMYVWAGTEPVGSVYPSPYAKNVATMSLRSGGENPERWFSEERDIVRDFEAYFGERPGRITAVAVMVDTDNTDSEVTTWFDDLSLGGYGPAGLADSCDLD